MEVGGDGYGYGYSDGDGYGDGYGYSDGGDGGYWAACIPGFTAGWTQDQRARLTELLGQQDVTVAYWRSDEQGRPANGGQADPVAVGTVQTVEGPLAICTERALHATRMPPKWKGERIWIVALHGELQEEDDKLGALKREILGEALEYA